MDIIVNAQKGMFIIKKHGLSGKVVCLHEFVE